MGSEASDIRRLISVVRDPGRGVRIVGNGLALPPVCASTEEWLARYGGERADLPAPPPSPSHAPSHREPERPAHTDVGGGIVLAHPEHEPPPAGKPGYRGARSAKWSRS